MERASERIKSPGGQVLAVGVALLAGAAGVLVVAEDGPSALLSVCPWLALVAGLAWAVYWRPEVVVNDGGVRLVNVLRTIDVPWPALRGIGTKWALTLETEWGDFRAWAAPAPGRSAMRRELREQRSAARTVERRVPNLPAATTGRPSDLLHSDSGAAAAAVHERWRRLQRAGYLDAAVTEHSEVPVQWHWELLAGAAVLIALGVIGLLI